MNKRLLLIGGGGHCHSVIDSVLSMAEYNQIGIIDSATGSYNGVEVIGNDDDLPRLFLEGWNEAFISVGSIENTIIRRRLYETIRFIGFSIPIIIDPSAIVANGCKIEKGSFIGKRAVINSGTSLGICSIVNTGAIVEHDCHIGDFSHISPGTVLCGQVNVGNDSHVGAGSVVRQQICIGNDVVIGIGSVVVKNVSDKVKAYGNPCKVVV